MTALAEHRSYLEDILARQRERRALIDPTHVFPSPPILSLTTHAESSTSKRNLPAGPLTSVSDRDDVEGKAKGKGKEGTASKENVVNYIAEEETVRNDHTAWYGSSGLFGSNYVLGARDEEICEEYPALKKLMNLKSTLASAQSHPPLYIHLPLPASDSRPASPSFSTTLSSDLLSSVGTNKFDVILVHPLSSWEQTSNLPIRQISADPGFVFLWVGKGDQEGLERGRECFAKWGFRRAEDIVWVKTNRASSSEGAVASATSPGSKDGAEGDVTMAQDAPNIDNAHEPTSAATSNTDERHPIEPRKHDKAADTGALFASQKEHCLMGIRGTVRRSTDMRFVHCNVDTDVMIWENEHEEGPDHGHPEKRTSSPHIPPYLYTLIENFCLGTRRLELFSPSPSTSLRRGWVTSSLHPLPTSNGNGEASAGTVAAQFDPNTYMSLVHQSDGRPVLSYSNEIDALRPKSPQRRPRNLPGPGQGQGGLTPNTTGGRPSPISGQGGRQFGGQPQLQSQGYGAGPRMGQGQMQGQPLLPAQVAMQGPAQGTPFNPMFGGQMNNSMGMGMGMNFPMNMGMMHPMMMGMGMGVPMNMGIGGMPTNMPMGMGAPNYAYQQGFGVGNPGSSMNMGMGGINGGQPGFAPGMGMDGMGYEMMGDGSGTGGMAGGMNQGQGGRQGGMGTGWQGGWQ